MQRKTGRTKLSAQVEAKVNAGEASPSPAPTYEGTDHVVSTGSTLLDLAISGGRFPYGGIPFGIFVEIFGPAGSGKTVLLSQIAGNIQAMGGRVMFHDPEARLNRQFAEMFGLRVDDVEYMQPDTIRSVFSSIRSWLKEKDSDKPHGIFMDSLAALSTEMEMESEEGDKMGMRRAREFSEELRRTCRLIADQNVLMVASNQIRENIEAGPYGQRYVAPGGKALEFYASLRLRCSPAEKIKITRKIRGHDHQRVIGVKTNIEVVKSSVWRPFRQATVFVIFDYGVDDVRGNLAFIKEVTGDSRYKLGGTDLGRSMEDAIRAVEEDGLEERLREEVVGLWREIEEKFEQRRKPRRDAQ